MMIKGISDNCVACNYKTANGLIHKETGEFYNFCLDCRDTESYDKENFNVCDYRDKVKDWF